MIQKFEGESAVQRLILEKSTYYRVKRGQTETEVENTLETPASACYPGAVIVIEDCFRHTVRPFESYQSIAKKYGVDEEELTKLNGNRPLYPTRKIFVPRSIHS